MMMRVLVMMMTLMMRMMTIIIITKAINDDNDDDNDNNNNNNDDDDDNNNTERYNLRSVTIFSPYCKQYTCSHGQGTTVSKSHATHQMYHMQHIRCITCNTSDVSHATHQMYHIQHIRCITCNMPCETPCNRTAQLLILTVQIRLISVLFYWLVPLTDEEGIKTGVYKIKTTTSSCNSIL